MRQSFEEEFGEKIEGVRSEVQFSERAELSDGQGKLA